MTQTEEQIENFTNAVGADLSNKFETQVSKTIKNLIESLEHRLIDDNTKVDYATHVFAKALDDMVDYLEAPKLLNWKKSWRLNIYPGIFFRNNLNLYFKDKA